MKKIELKKKTIFLSLIILWCAISVIFYWVLYLFESLKFADNIKYEIIGGYVSKQFLEKNICSHIFISIISIICILFSFVICILSYKKEKMIKFIGIGTIVQTFFMVFLKFWNDNLVYADYSVDVEAEIVSFKSWLIISTVTCIIISLIYSFYNKPSFIILGISTILQVFNTIELFKSNIGFLTQESITNTNYLSIVFQCINGIVIYILYWILLIYTEKSKSEE